MTAESPTLVNTMSIESPYGFRRINLYLGNLCAFQDDVLVVSSHANPNLPPDGSVIRAFRSAHGIDFSRLRPLIVTRGALGTFRVEGAVPSGSQVVLVVRIPGADHLDWDSEPLEVYRDAIWSVFGSVAALELGEFRLQSMAMPLVGGQRKYPIRDSMAILLEHAARWLKTSASMQTINMVLYEADLLPEWDRAMNQVLGRRFVDRARDHVLKGLSDEILSSVAVLTSLHETAEGDLKTPLENVLRADRINLQLAAAFGRKLAETVVRAICLERSLAWEGVFFNDIEALRKHRVVAPWMISHLHSLRVFGNETVHVKGAVSYRPAALEDEDLVPILVSLLRVMTFWKAWQEMEKTPQASG